MHSCCSFATVTCVVQTSFHVRDTCSIQLTWVAVTWICANTKVQFNPHVSCNIEGYCNQLVNCIYCISYALVFLFFYLFGVKSLRSFITYLCSGYHDSQGHMYSCNLPPSWVHRLHHSDMENCCTPLKIIKEYEYMDRYSPNINNSITC